MTIKDLKQEIKKRIQEDNICFCCRKKLTDNDYKIVSYRGFDNSLEITTQFECSKCGYNEDGDYWNIKRCLDDGYTLAEVIG